MADFATRNEVPTQEIAVLVLKSRAMPGNAVDTETISNAERKMVHIRENTTTKSFLGGICDDWSSIEMISGIALSKASACATLLGTTETLSSVAGVIVIDTFSVAEDIDETRLPVFGLNSGAAGNTADFCRDI